MQLRKLFVLTVATLAVAFISISVISMQQPAQAMQGSIDDIAPEPLPSPVCVFGWSKDNCNGSLQGDVSSYTCTRTVGGTTIHCRTRELRNAVLKFPVDQSSGTCSSAAEVLCDQVPELDGTIVIQGDFVFGEGRCRLRGAWSGRWKLVDLNGVTVASGSGNGTLGTGSHRAIGPCLLPIGYSCNPNCERCYDVQNVAVGIGTVWRVGLEGALQGRVFDGEWASSQINITLSGTLNTPGTDIGPNDFGNWFYCGASDGVVLAKCSQ